MAIDENNFPDADFREYVGRFDNDGNGSLSESEISGCTGINASWPSLGSLEGIEYFTALRELYCERRTGIRSLDVSQNPALEVLHCYSTGISSLDVSQNPALRILLCQRTKISSLDVSQNPALTHLGCGSTNIRSLDVSRNPALEVLSCYSTDISSLDVRQNHALLRLDCYSTDISSLDVSQNPALMGLRCGGTGVSSLDVSQNPALTHLGCGSTNIRSLDVSRNPALEELSCDNTNIRSLDVSQNPALRELWCHDTNISSLDISQNPVLGVLSCSGNVVWLDSSHQLDLAKYDPLFDKSKVTKSTYVEWNGNVITLQEGRDSGTYVYDCGRGETMTVTVRRSMLEKPTVFTDVPQIPGNWKYDSVRYVNDRSIMGGVGGSNLFQPDNKLTRAMFATVLYRMAREPETSYSSKFSDVVGGKWYSSAILWANSKGIVQGYSNGSYGINDNITREQIAKMLYLYGKSRGYDVSGTASLDGFTDKGNVNNWAEGFLQWAVHAKMISGKPNGDGSLRLDPKGKATRAECAKMLMMFLEKYN